MKLSELEVPANCGHSSYRKPFETKDRKKKATWYGVSGWYTSGIQFDNDQCDISDACPPVIYVWNVFDVPWRCSSSNKLGISWILLEITDQGVPLISTHLKTIENTVYLFYPRSELCTSNIDCESRMNGCASNSVASGLIWLAIDRWIGLPQTIQHPSVSSSQAVN